MSNNKMGDVRISEEGASVPPITSWSSNEVWLQILQYVTAVKALSSEDINNKAEAKQKVFFIFK
jgi:hypothetical protein